MRARLQVEKKRKILQDRERFHAEREAAATAASVGEQAAVAVEARGAVLPLAADDVHPQEGAGLPFVQAHLEQPEEQQQGEAASEAEAASAEDASRGV